MKLTDYISTQLILSHNQIKKNKKISKEYIRDKTFNSFKHHKNNHINSFETLKNEENIRNDENKLFLRLYSKTKKLYPTKITDTFKDLISHYENNNYKIPDLSDKKNIFSQNPFLTEGIELEQFYRAINMKKKFKKKQKHLDFIRKEMLMIESISYDKSHYVIDKDKDKTDKNKKDRKFNYFQADTVYDKIKEEKLRIKREKLNLKKIEQKGWAKKEKEIKIDISDDNSNIKKIEENKSNDNKNLKNLNSLSSIKNEYISTIQSYNRKATMSIKNSESTSTDYKQNTLNHFRSYKSPQTLKVRSPKKIKFKLLMEEQKNKLLKDIEETKNTMNNKDLMEKNITIENYTNKSKTSKEIKEKKNNETINENNDSNNIFRSLLQKMKLADDKKKKTFRYSKFLSQRIKGPMILNFFGQKAIKQTIIRKLNRENDPKKILDIYMNLHYDLFNHNEIEKLIKIYYQKILGYSQESINKIINLKLGDDLICELLEKYIIKSKEKISKHSTNPRVNKSLDEANKEIKALKRRYLIGKSLEIMD